LPLGAEPELEIDGIPLISIDLSGQDIKTLKMQTPCKFWYGQMRGAARLRYLLRRVFDAPTLTLLEGIRNGASLANWEQQRQKVAGMRALGALALAEEPPLDADVNKAPLLAQVALANSIGLSNGRVSDPFEVPPKDPHEHALRIESSSLCASTPSWLLREQRDAGASDAPNVAQILANAEYDDFRHGGWSSFEAMQWRLRVCLARLLRRRKCFATNLRMRGYFSAAAFPNDRVMRRHEHAMIAGLEG